MPFLLPSCPWSFKDACTTTKVRAAFDALAKSNNGVALNDILETGSNLYTLLTDMLIRFRSHRIGLTADISKTFREILFHNTEKDLHCFFIREPDGRLQDYRMECLTFGVKPSPYLATQVIQHLARAHSQNHPLANQAILTDFYVDDFLSGAETVREADTFKATAL